MPTHGQKLWQRGNGSGCDNIKALFHGLGLATDHRDGHIELGDDLTQKINAPLEGLDQGDGQIWPGEGNNYAGQSCPGADIYNFTRLRDQRGDGEAVGNMAIPDALALFRADQASLNPPCGKDLGIAVGLWAIFFEVLG